MRTRSFITMAEGRPSRSWPTASRIVDATPEALAEHDARERRENRPYIALALAVFALFAIQALRWLA